MLNDESAGEILEKLLPSVADSLSTLKLYVGDILN